MSWKRVLLTFLILALWVPLPLMQLYQPDLDKASETTPSQSQTNESEANKPTEKNAPKAPLGPNSIYLSLRLNRVTSLIPDLPPSLRQWDNVLDLLPLAPEMNGKQIRQTAMLFLQAGHKAQIPKLLEIIKSREATQEPEKDRDLCAAFDQALLLRAANPKAALPTGLSQHALEYADKTFQGYGLMLAQKSLGATVSPQLIAQQTSAARRDVAIVVGIMIFWALNFTFAFLIIVNYFYKKFHKEENPQDLPADAVQPATAPVTVEALSPIEASPPLEASTIEEAPSPTETDSPEPAPSPAEADSPKSEGPLRPLSSLWLFVILQWAFALGGLNFSCLLPQTDLNFTQTVLLANGLGYLVMLLFLYILLPRIRQDNCQAGRLELLGLTLPKLSLPLWAMGGLGLVVPLLILSNYVTSLFIGQPPESNNVVLDMAKQGSTADLIIIFLSAVIFAPFIEEITFRAVLFGGLRHHIGAWGAALFSACLFSISHGDPQAFLSLASLGLVLAFLYQSTGKLWASILTHALWNCNTLCLLILFCNPTEF